MKIINLTPHDINIFHKGEVVRTINSSGFVRASQQETFVGNIDGIPLFKTKFGNVKTMPESKKSVFYIVSQITAQALKQQGRTEDIFITHKAVRDENGRIIGCEALSKI